MVDLWRHFWIRETGMGQQVAQLHERYMMMMMMMMIYVPKLPFLQVLKLKSCKVFMSPVCVLSRPPNLPSWFDYPGDSRGSGYRNGYSDSLQDCWFGLRKPGYKRFFFSTTVHSGSGAHPDFCKMSARIISRDKATGSYLWPPPSHTQTHTRTCINIVVSNVWSKYSHQHIVLKLWPMSHNSFSVINHFNNISKLQETPHLGVMVANRRTAVGNRIASKCLYKFLGTK